MKNFFKISIVCLNFWLFYFVNASEKKICVKISTGLWYDHSRFIEIILHNHSLLTATVWSIIKQKCSRVFFILKTNSLLYDLTVANILNILIEIKGYHFDTLLKIKFLHQNAYFLESSFISKCNYSTFYFQNYSSRSSHHVDFLFS